MSLGKSFLGKYITPRNINQEHEGPVSKRIRKRSLAKQQSQGQGTDGGLRFPGGRLGVDRGRLDEEQETEAGQVAGKGDKVFKIFSTRAITTIIEDEGSEIVQFFIDRLFILFFMFCSKPTSAGISFSVSFMKKKKKNLNVDVFSKYF